MVEQGESPPQQEDDTGARTRPMSPSPRPLSPRSSQLEHYTRLRAQRSSRGKIKITTSSLFNSECEIRACVQKEVPKSHTP